MVQNKAFSQSFDLSEQWITIGRDSETCDITINHPEISARHCKMRTSGSKRIQVMDIGSRNGVSVDGKRIECGEVAVFKPHKGDLELASLTCRFSKKERHVGG